MTALIKQIRYFGQDVSLACDGLCNKAWGNNGRPKLFFIEPGKPPRALLAGEKPPDWDDYVELGDDELGEAPADPGTYEGGDAKPSATPLEDVLLMNRWCARECERSGIFRSSETITVCDLKKPSPNLRKARKSL